MENQMADSEMARFACNKGTYIREHIILGIIGSVLITGYLIYANEPAPWVGIIGAFAAIAVRGFYLASEHLGYVWLLREDGFVLPNSSVVPLNQIKEVRGIFSAVQVVTTTGDKHLIKYQSDRQGVIDTINSARNLA